MSSFCMSFLKETHEMNNVYVNSLSARRNLLTMNSIVFEHHLLLL